MFYPNHSRWNLPSYRNEDIKLLGTPVNSTCAASFKMIISEYGNVTKISMNSNWPCNKIYRKKPF